ncbi:MAG: siderophore-interacting protein [Burkholderiaceae bacterium]
MSDPAVPVRPRRVERIRHEIKRRELRVARVEQPSPRLRRVTLTGESLADFASASFDDHVKVFFDDEARRDYTPRSFDRAARELVLEFVLHGDHGDRRHGGAAAAWAAQAAPGQPLVVAGPRGSFVVPVDYDWHLLVGDETALPAIARRLEELPAGADAIVLACTRDPADRRAFASAADARVRWVDDDAGLVAAVRALALPAGEGYAWCAGEAATTAEIRRILVDEKAHPRDAIRAAAYWKRGAIAHHENLGD